MHYIDAACCYTCHTFSDLHVCLGHTIGLCKVDEVIVSWFGIL